MKIIKDNNINENIYKRKLSSPYIQMLRSYPHSSSKSMRKKTFNTAQRNKRLIYQYLKQGEKFMTKSEQIPKRKQIQLFQEKSHFSLLKQVSDSIIHDKINYNNNINLMNEINRQYGYSYINNRYENMKSKFNSETKKAFINNNKSNFVNISKVKYYEVSKKGCNLSDALIVVKKQFHNIFKKKKKKERNFSSKIGDYLKRPMSSIERYYIKYGAIP